MHPLPVHPQTRPPLAAPPVGKARRDTDYFINGCQCEVDENEEILSCIMNIQNLTDGGVIWAIERKTPGEAMDAFLSEPLIDGKSFWQLDGRTGKRLGGRSFESEDKFLNARLFDGRSILERLDEVMVYDP